MKPLIGVACKHRQSPFEAYMEVDYNQAILENGGIPYHIVAGASEYLLEEVVNYCQALLLPGGADIDPGLYGGKRNGKVNFDRKQDDFEIKLIQLALKNGLPILAVGRGMQLLNVVFGGTLFQDIGTEVLNAAVHQTENSQCPQMHRVVLRDGTRALDIFGKEVLVNSNHHQAIKDLGGSIAISGISTDGIIESIEYNRRDRWIVGVQWHPERANVTSMQPLYAEFFNQARQTGSGY
ncbi:MAG TPA: gamma-glutamyl-gamma-aminobutyrate hydrolase family protein [Bacillota bacterium]|nr:gamma-glutamyl-gamma-aminobutyrate hydrolase family protein [Bacillota bacterium]